MPTYHAERGSISSACSVPANCTGNGIMSQDASPSCEMYSKPLRVAVMAESPESGEPGRNRTTSAEPPNGPVARHWP